MARVGNERIVKGPWYEMAKCDPSEALLRRCLHHGLDINQGDWLGRTQLHAAAAWNQIDRAKLLLELGADINAIDAHSSTTPLGFAARCGYPTMVEFLLDNGADKDLPGEPNYSWAKPLAYARYHREHHQTKYKPKISNHWRLTGTHTDAPIEDYDRIIDLLQ